MADLDHSAEALDQLSFSEASVKLEEVIRKLESNQLEFEDSLKAYEQGVLLVKTLQSRLEMAQQKVTTLMGEIDPESDDSIDTSLS